MITTADRPPLFLRLAAPWAWRNLRRAAVKLHGFAATEQGSSLDMLLAAQRASDPRLVRLFMKHSLDEARHASRFREMAVHLDPSAAPRSWEQARARPEHLYERHGELGFVAFVYLSERRASEQFAVLAGHFEGHPQLGPLFSEIAREERFHVAYSARLLDERREAGQALQVERALTRVRLAGAWAAWRRAGRRLGDLASRTILFAVWLAVVPIFALTQRVAAPRSTGWRTRTALADPAHDARLQY